MYPQLTLTETFNPWLTPLSNRCPMIDADGLDYSQYKASEVEKQMASGGMMPEGFYLTILNGAKPITSREKNTPGWELTYKVTDGPMKDRELTDRIYAPDLLKQASRNKVLIWKHRLGLIRRNPTTDEFEPVEGKKDYMDCMDTPVIIHVVHEEYTRSDNGQKAVSAKLHFNGLYSPTDPKALEKVEETKKKPGGPATNGTATPSTLASPAPAGTAATNAPKRFDTADL